MIIRKAEPKDNQQIIILMNKFLEERGEDNFTRRIYWENFINYTIYVCENENKIIGVLGYLQNFHIAIAEFIYVKPEHRDEMIAGCLLKKAKKEGKEIGISIIRIIIKPEEAKRYIKLGFKITYNIIEEVI